jgi:hypothetical protein
VNVITNLPDYPHKLEEAIIRLKKALLEVFMQVFGDREKIIGVEGGLKPGERGQLGDDG